MRFIFTILLLIGAPGDALLGAQRPSLKSCQERLADIRDGNLSADDHLVINECIINGYIDGAQVTKAFDSAKARRR